MQHYFDNVKNIITKLRDPVEGCPWDLEQTHESLSPYLIEECYELLNTLLKNDPDHMKEELGDVLLQVLLHAQLKSEENQFSMEDVCNSLADKMIRRHPHVFDKENNDKPSMKELYLQWDQIKEKEGKKNKNVFPEKDLFYPSLHSSFKIGKKSAEIDFDWTEIQEVLKKVEEELLELKETLPNKILSQNGLFENKTEEELGDFLFTAAQLSRHLGYDPEVVLHKANQKFMNRFQVLLNLVETDKKKFETLTRDQKEEYWKKVKKHEVI